MQFELFSNLACKIVQGSLKGEQVEVPSRALANGTSKGSIRIVAEVFRAGNVGMGCMPT